MMFLLAILVPMVASAVMLIGSPPGKARLLLLPLAPLPALLLALFGDADGTAVMRWVLLETHFGLAHSGPAFLFFSAALWAIAGWSGFYHLREADGSGVGTGRFSAFWLLTLAGNIGLVLAGDVPSFYTFFAIMTFAAYGLIVSNGTRDAWRAGRIYVVMALAGEAMLIGAFVLAVAGANSFLLVDAAASVAGSSHRNLIVLLVLGGFGVKAGVLPMHFWLPLAHPVAPTPASAVLSGVMIKAGLLGWMHLFPGGHGAFPGWSFFLIGLGGATAFYGVARGLPQRNLKTVLAYSSVSQMGILLLVVGAGLAEPEAWEMAKVVVIVYALNHAFSKGALFLGAGLCAKVGGVGAGMRRLILVGLTLPALAIAGAPLTGGAVAKKAVKLATGGAADLVPWLGVVLPLSAIATAMILGRFLILARVELRGPREKAGGKPVPRSGGSERDNRGLLVAWVAGLGASVFGVYFAASWYGIEVETGAPGVTGMWDGLWPIGAGALLLALGAFVARWRKLEQFVPPRDLMRPIGSLMGRCRPLLLRLVGTERWGINFYPAIERWAEGPFIRGIMIRGEAFFRQRETVGFLMMLFILVFWFLLGP